MDRLKIMQEKDSFKNAE